MPRAWAAGYACVAASRAAILRLSARVASRRRHTRETGRNGPLWGVSQGCGDALDGRLSRKGVDIMEIQHVEFFEKI